MKSRLLCSALLCLIPLLANAKAPLTSDPLTKLPLYPAAATGPLGPEDPVQMPAGTICKSKFEGDFYSIATPFGKEGVKVDATVAWCVANLKDFKHAHGVAGGKSYDVFYKADGTLVVFVLASPGAKKESNPKTDSLSYQTYTPGLAEKTIVSMTEGKLVCP